jgi:hypothetical protein
VIKIREYILEATFLIQALVLIGKKTFTVFDHPVIQSSFIAALFSDLRLVGVGAVFGSLQKMSGTYVVLTTLLNFSTFV